MMGNGAQRARGVNVKQQEEWEAEDKLLALGKGRFLFPAEALRSSVWVRGGKHDSRATLLLSPGFFYSVGRTRRRCPGKARATCEFLARAHTSSCSLWLLSLEPFFYWLFFFKKLSAKS